MAPDGDPPIGKQLCAAPDCCDISGGLLMSYFRKGRERLLSSKTHGPIYQKK